MPLWVGCVETVFATDFQTRNCLHFNLYFCNAPWCEAKVVLKVYTSHFHNCFYSVKRNVSDFCRCMYLSKGNRHLYNSGTVAVTNLDIFHHLMT